MDFAENLFDNASKMLRAQSAQFNRPTVHDDPTDDFIPLDAMRAEFGRRATRVMRRDVDCPECHGTLVDSHCTHCNQRGQ